jgi:hypothetical protein
MAGGEFPGVAHQVFQYILNQLPVGKGGEPGLDHKVDGARRVAL